MQFFKELHVLNPRRLCDLSHSLADYPSLKLHTIPGAQEEWHAYVGTEFRVQGFMYAFLSDFWFVCFFFFCIEGQPCGEHQRLHLPASHQVPFSLSPKLCSL